MKRFRKIAASFGVGALLVTGSLVGAASMAAPASATQVDNMMLCEPATGWCFQTNPPYNSSFPHYCQWDTKLTNLNSGMWYTGCNVWGPEIT
jgi:hypothetical protein